MAIEFKDFQKLPWYSRIGIVVAISGGLLALVWYQFLSHMETDIAAKTAQLTELQAQVAKATQQQKVFEQFKKESKELEVRLESLKRVLPQEKETDEVLRQAQSSASASSLRILRVAPRPLIDHEVYVEWPIEMEVVGTYHNIGAFLDRIRHLPRIVNISNLRIQSRAAEGDAAFTASVGATYTATTFVYREEQAAVDAPPPAPAR